MKKIITTPLIVLSLIIFSSCQTVQPEKQTSEEKVLSPGGQTGSTPAEYQEKIDLPSVESDVASPIETPERSGLAVESDGARAETSELPELVVPLRRIYFYSPLRDLAVQVELPDEKRQTVNMFRNSWSEPVKIALNQTWQIFAGQGDGIRVGFDQEKALQTNPLFLIIPDLASPARAISFGLGEDSNEVVVVNLTDEVVFLSLDQQESQSLPQRQAHFLTSSASSRQMLRISAENGQRTLDVNLTNEYFSGTFLVILPPFLASGREFQSRILLPVHSP